MNGSSTLRAIRGPITLITVGALFALNNFTSYTFDKTWPVLLIVFGLLSLVRRGMEPPRQPAFPPYGYSPPAERGSMAAGSGPAGSLPGGSPTAGSPPGSYSQSPYAGTPQQPFAPVKGGFGSSAPQSSSAPPSSAPGPSTGARPGGDSDAAKRNAPPSGDSV